MHWYEYLVLILGTGLLGAIVQILLSNFLSLNMSKIEKQKEVYNEFLLQLQEVAVPNNRDNTFNLVVARKTISLLLEDFYTKKVQHDGVMAVAEALCMQIPTVQKLVSIKGIGLLTVDGFFTKNTKQMSI